MLGVIIDVAPRESPRGHTIPHARLMEPSLQKVQSEQSTLSSFRLPLTPAALILVLALVVRLLYAFLAPRVDPIISQNPLYGDASGYHILAENLLKGWGLSWDGDTLTSFRMPGFPAFLAGIYAVAGANPLYVRIVHAVLGAATCLPVMAIARRLGGRRVSMLAGAGVALHPLLVYMTGWVYSETLFFLLLWTGLLLLLLALDRSSTRWSVLSGLSLGLATLVRPEILAFPLATLAGGWLLLRWPRARLITLLIVQAAALAVVLPWTIRNTIVHQSFVPLTTNTGVVFFGGNNPGATGGFFLEDSFVLPGYTEAESNQELTRRAAEWIRQNPGDYLALVPRKLYKFFAPAEMEHSGSPLGRWTWPVNLAYGLFLAVAAWGATRSWRRTPVLSATLVALIGWYVIVALILYGGSRVALPIAPALVTFGAVGLGTLLGAETPDEAPLSRTAA